MKRYDVCVVESSYEKDGKNKNNYRKVGTMIENDDGLMSIKLDRFFNPLGALNNKRECWLSVFEQKEREQQNVNHEFNNVVGKEVSDLQSDIPF